MRHLIDPETMRDCERAYFAGGADTSIEAMERAACALADCAMEYFGEIRENVIAVCGTGGNGGDGYACARILKSRGYDVSVLPIAPPKSADAIENARRAREANVPFLDAASDADAALWIDCIYGTGLSRVPEGNAARIIRHMNASRGRVLACDIPSGLNGRTGAACDPCVRAVVTATLQRIKTGLVLQDGLDVCGEIIVRDIGFPDSIFPQDAPDLIEPRDLHSLFAPRRRNLHKGGCGHLLIIAGSMGMAGAAALCARAALRTGAGLVTIACPVEIMPILQTLAPCAMCIPLSAENVCAALTGKTAVSIGCGLTRAFDPEILRIVLESGLPAAIDADALNVLSMHPELSALLRPHHVLTPHPGEAARLLGHPCADPVSDARELAGRGCCAVLKGASRAIADAAGAYVSASGSCCMARGGSGDVYTGILGALLAERADRTILQTAAAACELHGLCGEAAERKYGRRAANSADLIEFLPEVCREYAD